MARQPQWARASSFTRFLDHTLRRTTVGRTPLDEWSARRRDLSLTTHNTHNRQTSTPPVGFEPTISAGERPQTHTLDRAATETGWCNVTLNKFKFKLPGSNSTFCIADCPTIIACRRSIRLTPTVVPLADGPPCRIDDCLDVVYCMQHVGGNITCLRDIVLASIWFFWYSKTGEKSNSVIPDNY